MSRRDPHPVNPSRGRRIENPDEYQKGKRDGEADQDQKPDPPKDAGGSAYEVAITIGAFAILVVLVLAGVAAVDEIKGW